MWLLTLVSGESREEREGFTSSRDSEPLSRCVEPLCEDAPAGVLVSLREREEKCQTLTTDTKQRVNIRKTHMRKDRGKRKC